MVENLRTGKLIFYAKESPEVSAPFCCNADFPGPGYLQAFLTLFWVSIVLLLNNKSENIPLQGNL